MCGSLLKRVKPQIKDLRKESLKIEFRYSTVLGYPHPTVTLFIGPAKRLAPL